MCSKAVCRTCLANNIRMQDLKHTPLRETFEKLTSIKLGKEDGRSRICYICYAQLQRCRRFLDMSKNSEKMLSQILTKGIEMIPDSLTIMRASNNFIVTPVVYMSLPERPIETMVTVKIEPEDIKEETIELDNSSLFESVKIEGSPLTDNFMKRVCVQESLDVKMPAAVPHKCDTCNKTYETQKSLRRHVTKGHKRLFRCKVCDKEFTKYDELISHTATHREDELYACNFCEKTFTIKYKLKNHIRSHTKPFCCHLCDKAFSELSSLRKHVASHSTNKPYICGTCSKSFTHKSFLVVHLRTHTGEKPFACNLCDKTFAQIAHAISHKRTHALPQQRECNKIPQPKLPKRKEYACSLCGKLFAFKNCLNRHRRIHTGERPYACEICNKKFATQDTMKTHMRRHTGEKPFTCISCGKGFCTSGNMRKHMKTHEASEENPKSEQYCLFDK